MESTAMKLGFSTETFTLEGGSKQNVDVECFGLATIEKDPYTFEYFHVLLRIKIIVCNVCMMCI